MPYATASQIFDANISEVWASWDRYDEIYRFNPDINQTIMQPDSAPTGMGAERRCNHVNGKNFIYERVIGYEPEKKMVVDIYKSNLPLKRAVVTVEFFSLPDNRTKVIMSMNFAMKFGPLGFVMGHLAKGAFKISIAGLLAGNAAFVEKGIEIHPKAA